MRVWRLYEPRHLAGIVAGLAGCLAIYLVYAHLNGYRDKPDAPSDWFQFSAPIRQYDASGTGGVTSGLRLYVYLGVGGCRNPVRVLIFLMPPRERPASWVPGPVSFVTTSRGARDFRLYEGPYGFTAPPVDPQALETYDLAPFFQGNGTLSFVFRTKQIAVSPTGSLANGRGLTFEPGVRGISHRALFDDPNFPARTKSFFVVSYLADLVGRRSFGSCYVAAPGGLGMGMFEEARPGGLGGGLAQLNLRGPTFYGDPAGTIDAVSVERYQLLDEAMNPTQPFSREVDPPDSTVSVTPGGLVSWTCARTTADCNGGFVAIVAPDADVALSNDDFLLGTALGILAGLIAASALQFDVKRGSAPAGSPPRDEL
jgi:hypothetical protein